MRFTLGMCLCALLCGSWQVAALPTNLVRNSSFEQRFAASGPADFWRARTGVGALNDRVEGIALDGRDCHTIQVPPEAEATWYIASQVLERLVPGRTYTLSGSIKTDDVRDGHGAYIAVNYLDASGQRLAFTDSEQHLTGTNDWTRTTQTFSPVPGTHRVELCLVLHGHGTAWFDCVQIEDGTTATPWSPREERAVTGQHEATGGRIAILSDDLPAVGTPSDPGVLRTWLEGAGYACDLLSADELADPARLSAATYDLLVLPYGSAFPAPAVGTLRTFLRDAGDLLAFGGYPFDRLVARQNGRWAPTDELEPDEASLKPLFAGAAATEGWTVGGRDIPTVAAPTAPGRGGTCLVLSTPSLSGWVTLSSPRVGALPAGATCTAFWARADQDDVWLHFEWHERDQSRWRTKVMLSREWRLYAAPNAQLEYWKDNPSKGRGGPGDSFRPANAEALSFGLTGESLQEGRPYTAYIQGVSTGLDPFGEYRGLTVNSHYGGVNMATFLEPPADAISICDASSPLSDATELVPVLDALKLPANWTVRSEIPFGGFSATGQTAQGNAGAPLKARWAPLVRAADRYGRTRGTAFGIMHNYAGEYPGSSWAYSGIDSTDLFAVGSDAGRALLLAVVGRLADRAFLFDAAAAFRSVRPGEEVAPSVAVANASGAERTFTVGLRVVSGSETLFTASQPITVAPRSSEAVPFAFSAPREAPSDLLVLQFELSADARPIDSLKTGVVVWDEKRQADGPPVGYEDCYFSVGDGPEYLIGTQIYWGNQTITGMDPLRWDTQLRTMADSGVRVARSFMSGGLGGWDEPPVRYRDALVQLAEDHQVALFYSNVSWPSTDPAVVAEKAKVGRAAAERYRQAPGWFVDIVNEPAMRIGESESDSVEFRAYLRKRYGSTEALRRAWGASLTEPSLDEVKITPIRGAWADRRAIDTNWFMSESMREWTKVTRDAIREADPDRLVSVGHLQGFGGPDVALDPILASRDMDFTNRHYYGAMEGYAPELMEVDMRTLGKAPSTGEFGATSHPGLRAHFVYQPESEAAWRYSYVAHTCFGLGGAFVANWHWQDPIEDIFPCGALLADGAPRDRFYGYRNSGVLLRQIRPVYAPPEVYFVIPTSHRFGASKGAIEQAMVRSLRTLLGVHVEVGTIDEEQLDTLPEGARALIWPVPYCPSDESYARVLEFVRGGGALYLSGDVSYDTERHRTRTQRLEELCGVRFVAERYPDIQYRADASAQVRAEGDSPLAVSLARSGLNAPCIEVEPAGAHVLAWAGAAPLATLNRVGAGQVLLVTDPAELHAEPTGVVRAFLDGAGVHRHALTPDVDAIHSHRVAGEDGAIAHVVLNLSDTAQHVEVTDLPQPLAIDLAPKSAGAAVFDAEGRLVAAEGVRVEANGRTLLRSEAPAIVVALDKGVDLRSAQRVVVLPFGPGDLELPRLDGGASAAVGDVRDGHWVEYDSVPVKDGRLRLDAAMAHSWIAFAPEGERAELGRSILARCLRAHDR